MGEQDIEVTLLPNRLVQLAAKAAQTGNMAETWAHCAEVLARDPFNEDALLWQNVATESMPEKIRLLQKVLSINPANYRAKTLLTWAESRQRRGEAVSPAMEIELLTPCPYLGTAEDRQARFTYPCPGNVCHAEANQRRAPREVSDETQRDNCLTVDHLACPTYCRAIFAARRHALDTMNLHDYFEFFGLDEEPFNIVPTPRFFYPTRQHDEALRLLRQVIEHRQGLAVLAGQVGLGKTLILRVLYEDLFRDPRYAVAFFPHSSWGTEHAMMTAIFRALGVAPARRRSLRDLEASLEDYLMQQVFQAHKTVVFLFDEAQAMSPRILSRVRRILDFHVGNQQMAQIILAGQPRLLEKVKGIPALQDRVVASYVLTPLSPSDVKAFISARLHEAGSQNGLFTSAAVRTITDLTHGSPRRINVLCMRCLIDAFERNVHSIDQELVLRTVDQHPTEVTEPKAVQEAVEERSLLSRLRFLWQQREAQG